MKMRQYSEVSLSERNENREWTVLHCPVCHAVWYDDKEENPQMPAQTCEHLRFSLGIITGVAVGEGYAVKVLGEWDGKTFESAIQSAFRETTLNWKEALQGIQCPDVDEVVYHVNSLTSPSGITLSSTVFVFGYCLQGKSSEWFHMPSI